MYDLEPANFWKILAYLWVGGAICPRRGEGDLHVKGAEMLVISLRCLWNGFLIWPGVLRTEYQINIFSWQGFH